MVNPFASCGEVTTAEAFEANLYTSYVENPDGSVPEVQFNVLFWSWLLGVECNAGLDGGLHSVRFAYAAWNAFAVVKLSPRCRFLPPVAVIPPLAGKLRFATT